MIVYACTDRTGQVRETAKSTDAHSLSAPLLETCRFAPLLRGGVPTYYKGDIQFLLPQ